MDAATAPTKDKPLIPGKPPVTVPVVPWDWKVIWNWRKAPQFHTIQLSVFWGALSGVYMALPAFAGTMSPRLFAGACIGLSVVMVVARLTHQPGLD